MYVLNNFNDDIFKNVLDAKPESLGMGAPVRGEGDAVLVLQGEKSDNDNVKEELVVEVTVD